MYYIYLIINKVNNKTYVGQRKCPANKFPEQDISYMGSGVYLKNAQEKYGIENFSKEILAVAETQENIDILERVFIALYRQAGKAEYNIANGGNTFIISQLPSDIMQIVRQKMKDKRLAYIKSHPECLIEHSRKMKGRKLSEETKKKIGLKSKGRKLSLQARKKISVARKGIKMSQAFREKCRENNLGRKVTEETRLKMSNSQKSRKVTAETRLKMKLNHKGSKGKHWNLSEETRLKMKLNHKGANIWTKNYYWFTNGVENIRAKKCPEGFYKGRTLSQESKEKMCRHSVGIKTRGSTGMKWFTNGVENKLCFECPEGFYAGKIHKK